MLCRTIEYLKKKNNFLTRSERKSLVERRWATCIGKTEAEKDGQGISYTGTEMSKGAVCEWRGMGR